MVQSKGNISEIIYEYEYDKMNSPFKNMRFSLPNGFFDFGECYSNNNIKNIKKTGYLYNMGPDTIVKVTNQRIEYRYQNGYPVERNGQYIFKYAYLN